MNNFLSLATPLGRVVLGAFFALAGAGKISGYEATAGYMAAMGVPGALLPLVIALELVGGLALIAGWRTRTVAFLLAGFSLVAALLFHGDFSDPMQSILFMKNLAIAGGLLLLVGAGAGKYSVDGRVR